MWSKNWCLKRNISCDVHLLNELLQTDVPWDDAIVVSAGKLKKLWDSLSELRSSVCERRLERTFLRSSLLSVKTAQFTQFFRQVWPHTVKSLSLTYSVQGVLRSNNIICEDAIEYTEWRIYILLYDINILSVTCFGADRTSIWETSCKRNVYKCVTTRYTATNACLFVWNMAASHCFNLLLGLISIYLFS